MFCGFEHFAGLDVDVGGGGLVVAETGGDGVSAGVVVGESGSYEVAEAVEGSGR